MAIALDSASRQYRKGIPVEHMQARIVEAIRSYAAFVCLLVDEADNLRPNADGSLTFVGKTRPRKVSWRLTEKDVDVAEPRLETDKTVALVRALASPQRLALQACYMALSESKKVFTGQAYGAYRNVCIAERAQPLSQTRFSDIIGALDLYGLIKRFRRKDGCVYCDGRYPGLDCFVHWYCRISMDSRI